MKNVTVVFGTRPEAIKMAPVVAQLARFPSEIETTVCVTGQHRGMLDQVLALFNITPNIDLNVMRPNQALGDVTAHVVQGCQEAFHHHRPDIVMVHGDTTSSFGAALAAFYEQVPVGHVEAGLRTHDLTAPFPEEFNRQSISKLATWHFAPTEDAKHNLLAEGIAAQSILVTGNTVVDALLGTIENIEKDDLLRASLEQDLDRILEFSWREEPYLLVTAHRRENFGRGIDEICSALASLSSEFPTLHILFPVHRNPMVLSPVHRSLGSVPNVHLLEPSSYAHFAWLLKHSHLVLTDSGGVQEEAPTLDIPVLIMRDKTERPEATEAGTARLIGAHKDQIVSGTRQLLHDSEEYAHMSRAVNPFGDGKASERIVDALLKLGLRS